MTASHAQVVDNSVILSGGCEFLDPKERSERCKELAEQGFLLARVVAQAPAEDSEERPPESGPRTLVCGSLGAALDDAVELSLALRGAVPPSVEVAAQPLSKARDQLFRVRALGGRGLCLVLPSLRYLAGEGGVLHPHDGQTLQMWRELARITPVRMLIEEGDRAVKALAPQPLALALDIERPAEEPELSEDELSALNAQLDDDLEPVDPHQQWHDEDDGDLSECTVPIVLDAPEKPVSPASLLRDDPLLGLELDDEPDEHLSAVFHPPVERRSDAGQGAASEPGLADALNDEDDEPASSSLFERPSRPSRSPLLRPPARPPRKPVLAAAEVDRFAAELDAASGPKPVTVIEELFTSRYAPLREALDDGLTHPDAERTARAWSAAFERSYSSSFKALRVTGKRPNMVLDAPDLAVRAARTHGARHVQLLLVDSMRYDLGRRVMRQLLGKLDGAAECVEEHLLWAALPTTTPVQLNLLARGPAGLREPEPDSDREPGIFRGKSVTTLRRVRIGRRDLAKLDVVEARLREAGGAFVPRMDTLADEVSEVIAAYAEQLEPRTLLYVFADHGFVMPGSSPHATEPAEQGGASPEEVFVGGYALLLGDDDES